MEIKFYLPPTVNLDKNHYDLSLLNIQHFKFGPLPYILLSNNASPGHDKTVL